MLFFLLVDVSLYFYNCQKNISLVTFGRNIEMIFKIIVLNFKKAEVKKKGCQIRFIKFQGVAYSA